MPRVICGHSSPFGVEFAFLVLNVLNIFISHPILIRFTAKKLRTIKDLLM